MNGNVFPKNETMEQAAIHAAAVEAVDRLDKEQGFDFTTGAALYPSSIALEQMGGASFSTDAARYPSGMDLGALAGEDEDKGNKWIWAALLLGGGYWGWKKYGKKGRK